MSAIRKLAAEAADNGLLAPELAQGISRVRSVKSTGIRVGNWLSQKQPQELLSAPDITTVAGLRDRAILAVLLGCWLRRSEVAALTFACPAAGRALVHRQSCRKTPARPYRADASMGEGGDRCVDCGRQRRSGASLPPSESWRMHCRRTPWGEGRVAYAPAICRRGWGSRHRTTRPESHVRQAMSGGWRRA